MRRKKFLFFSLDRFKNRGGGSSVPEVISPKEGPEEAVARREEEETVQGLMAALPLKYRTTLILRYVEELSCEEIAQILNLPAGAVKVRIHRARKMLRKKVRDRRRE